MNKRSTAMNSVTHPLRVNFVSSSGYPELKLLGMTFAPGKKQKGALSGTWDRDLSMDLDRLKEFYGIRTIVSLVEDFELVDLSIRDLELECAQRDINLIRFPIKDGSIPTSITGFIGMVEHIASIISQGE